MSQLKREHRERATLGLALGGGAARGAAHIGVLRAFLEHDLKPDYITGTSVGALVGGLFACGVDLNELRKEASELSWMDMAAATLSRYGLLSNAEVGKLVKRFVGDKKIEKTDIPFAAVATDLATGQPVIMKEGSLADAVMASTAIPGVFVPAQYDGRLLVDGGLVENVPLSPLAGMGAEVLVGVDLSGQTNYGKPKNLIDVIMNAMDIAIDTTTQMHVQAADVLIRMDLSEYSRTDASDVRELVAEGYRAGVVSLRRVEAEIASRQPTSWQVLEQKFREWRESID